MPITAGAMMAAGYSATTAWGTEGLTWVGPPVAYWAYNKYKNKNSNTYKMGKRTYAQQQLNVRPTKRYRPAAPMRRKAANFYRRKIPRAVSYNSQHDADRKYVVLKDMKELLITSWEASGPSFRTVQAYELLSAPAYSRYSNLYSQFKLVKIVAKFFQENGVGMLSMVSQDTIPVLPADSASVGDKDTARDFFLRQPSLRTHDLGSDKHNAQRTLKMRDTIFWADYIKIGETATKLGDASAPGTHKANMNFCIYPTGNSQANGTERNIRIVMHVEFHCIFHSLQDTVGGLDVPAIGNGYSE